MKRGYLIDMDGVIYRGGELIPGAQAFLKRLMREDIPFFVPDEQQSAHALAM